jgi:hypothetical protein
MFSTKTYEMVMHLGSCEQVSVKEAGGICGSVRDETGKVGTCQIMNTTE